MNPVRSYLCVDWMSLVNIGIGATANSGKGRGKNLLRRQDTRSFCSLDVLQPVTELAVLI
jgi:hypothetical protein